MPDSGQGNSRIRPIALWLGLLVLIALIVGMCRFAGPGKTPPATAAIASRLKAGIEIVARDEAAGLITLRNNKTGDTVQITATDFSDEKVDQAFARLIATREKSASSTVPAAEAVIDTGAAHPSSPAKAPEETPSGQAGNAGADNAKVTAPAAPETVLPPFVSKYPGATTITIATTHDGASLHGDYEFSTADSPQTVGKYYGDKAIAEKLLIVANVAGTNPDGPTSTLIVEDATSGKTLSLTAVIENGHTRGSITFARK